MRNKTTMEETLTNNQIASLVEARELVTIEMLNDLEHGEQIELNEDFCLYHYEEDDLVVLNLSEEWEEIYCVLWGDDGQIIFEAL